jgi:hypothetical protein
MVGGENRDAANFCVYQPMSRKKLQVEEEEEEAGYTIHNLFRTLRAKINRLILTNRARRCCKSCANSRVVVY